MISCKFVVDRLALYLAGEIDKRWADFIAAHLLHCGRCARVAEKMQTADAEVRASFQATILVPESLDKRVMAAISALPTPGSQPATSLPRWLRLGSAPLVMALVGIGFALGRLPKSDPTPPPIELSVLRRAHGLAERDGVGGSSTDELRPLPVYAVEPPLPGVFQKRYLWRGTIASEFSFDEHLFDRPNLSRDVFNGPPVVIGERDGYSYAVWCEGETHFVLIARVDSVTMLTLLSRRLGR